MSKKRIEQKPSETALFAALRRAIANKEYENDKFGPDDLSDYFLPPHFRFLLKFKKIRVNIKNKLNRFLPGLNEYMIARTVSCPNPRKKKEMHKKGTDRYPKTYHIRSHKFQPRIIKRCAGKSGI